MGKWGIPVAVVAAVGLTGAFAFFVGPGRPGRDCEQPPWELSVTAAAPGRTVVVSADESASCDPVYGWDAEIDIILYDAGMQPIQAFEAPMTSRGAFSIDLVIPPDLPSGQYMVTALPKRGVPCDDTNAMVTGVQLIRAACVLPVKTLTVAPGT